MGEDSIVQSLCFFIDEDSATLMLLCWTMNILNGLLPNNIGFKLQQSKRSGFPDRILKLSKRTKNASLSMMDHLQ